VDVDFGLLSVLNNRRIWNIASTWVAWLMMQDVHVTLNPWLPWWKQRSIRRLFSSANRTSSLRKEAVKCYIWSIIFYGAENWTFRKVHQKYLESFEMWTCRKKDCGMNGWMNEFIYLFIMGEVSKPWSSRYVFRKYVLRILIIAPIILKLFYDFPHSLQQTFEMLPQYYFLFPGNFCFIFPVYLIIY